MAEPNGKTYALETLVDVWNLEDPDRIARALSAIAAGMIEARTTLGAIRAAARAVRPDLEFADSHSPWPRVLEWTDDGKNEVTIRYHVGGEHLFDRKITLQSEQEEG